MTKVIIGETAAEPERVAVPADVGTVQIPMTRWQCVCGVKHQTPLDKVGAGVSVRLLQGKEAHATCGACKRQVALHRRLVKV